MNRMIRGMAGLIVALGASACVTDPSVDYASDPSTIVLDPEVMFVTHGTEKQVFARLVDERNRATPTEFTITNVSPGLSVRVDSQYRLDYINGDSLSWRPLQYQHRLWVASTAPTGAMGQFTVNAQGFSTTATARILPANLGTGVSSTSPAIGEVVTITAPANLSFTSNATVAIVDGNTVVNTVITDQSDKAISFVPFPGSTGVVRVTGVTLDYAPTLASRTLASASTITVPADPSSPTLSHTAPDLGTPVTITAGPGQAFSANSAVSFDPGGAAVVTARTATTLTILPRPGSGGVATVTNVILTDGEAELLGTFTRTTSNAFTTPVPAVTVISGTWSNAAPAVGTPVTFTSAQFKFLPTVAVNWGGRGAAVTAISPDSSSITVLPPVGVSGPATIVNAALNFLLEVPLAATPTAGGVATSAAHVAAKLPNSEAIADETGDPAAPSATVGPNAPGAAFIDGGSWAGGLDAIGGGGPNRWYKLEVTGPTRTRNFSVDWDGLAGADIDLFVGDADVAQVIYRGTSARPETGSASIAAGTYWIVVINWNNLGTPNWVYTWVH